MTVIGLVSVALLTRFGLLAQAASIFVVLTMEVIPPAVDWSAWYAGRSIFGLAAIVALGAYGCQHAMAGVRVFRPLLDERG